MIFAILFWGTMFTVLAIRFFKFLSNRKFKKYISLDNIPTEFENIYKTLYNNYISSLEIMRKKIINLIIFAFLFCIINCIFFMFLVIHLILHTKDLPSGILIIISIFITAPYLFFLFKIRNYRNKYINLYKEKIIPEFVKLVNNKLEYSASDISLYTIEHDYLRANFNKESYRLFKADDYISGFLDDETFVEMCDLTIQSHNENKCRHDIFRGMFVQAKYNKNIGAYMKVSLNKLKSFNSKDKVEMDSSEFEEYFDIYSDNKIVAMQILTSDIMQFLTDFYIKYKINYEIVFRNDTLYMRFFTGSMFEPTLLKNAMDKELLYMYYFIMNFIMDILKKVNKTLQDTEI